MAAFMDELVIDPISGEQISARHAVVLPIVKDIGDVCEYVKSVGSSIGANNIRSAYKTEGRVKIYLRYAKHVDELVSNGVRLRGHYATVEYSVLPATRVLLKNVDTEIPNRVISSKLEAFGKVSRISTLKANIADPEYSHVESNERQAFMLVTTGFDIPPKLDIFHENRRYVLDVHVQKPEGPVESSTVAETVPSSTSMMDDKDGVDELKKYNVYDLPVEDVQSNQSSPETKRVSMRGRGIKHTTSKRGYRRGRGSLTVKISQPSHNVIPTGLKKIVRTKRGGGRGRRGFRRGSVLRSHRQIKTITDNNISLNNDVSGNVEFMEATQSSTIVTFNENYEDSNISSRSGLLITNVQSTADEITVEPQICIPEFEIGDVSPTAHNGVNGSPTKFEINEKMCGNLHQYPFDYKTLDKFLKEVKNHRNPMDVALNLLDENGTPGATNDLCNQLVEFSSCASDTATRLRLSRLVYLLSGGRKTL